MARVLTRTAQGYDVWRKAHTGTGCDPATDWGEWTLDANLLPVAVQQLLCPRVHAAKVEIDLATLDDWPWNWADYVSRDDQIAIISRETAGNEADRVVLFAGFLTDVHWGFSRGAQALLTAVGTARRLSADVAWRVYGRYMLDKGGDLRHFSGLPCSFNAGGEPNRAADKVALVGGPAGGVPVFTYDEDPSAVAWTISDILDYLMWQHNAAQTWIDNASLGEADYARAEPIVLSVDGMGLWAALGAACDRAGYDLWESYTIDAVNHLPVVSIAIKARHAGTQRTVKHQAPTWDAETETWTRADLDLTLTNLFAAQVAESSASCVTAPVVAGGRSLYEITIPLGRAWDSSRLAIPTGEEAELPDPDEESDYFTTYCQGGTEFPGYADVGRLWDANTDGRYSDSPYYIAVPDVADLAGETAATWPQMPYPPRPCLSRLYQLTSGPSHESLLEVTFDGGTNWQAVNGYEVLKDRLGVRLTVGNLADIRPVGWTDEYTENLFYALAEDVANETNLVQMRLTCTIEGPERNVVGSAIRASAGTCFPQSEWVEREALGQIKTLVGTTLSAYGVVADTETEANATARLTAVATAYQDAYEGRSIEASLPIEWPDEALGLSDVVTAIDGIAYSLQTNAGETARYPRIVAIHFHLTPETHNMVIGLDTDRLLGLSRAMEGSW
ncbi:MAG: hypothetical protein WC789_13805 [Lentisphaeria bacterium]